MNISIFGLGYVGCVSLGCLAKNGHTVIGVDISTTKVNQINKGLPTIIEKNIDIIISEQHKAGRIAATTDFKKAILETDTSIIAVGTPTSAHGQLNLEYIFKVAEDFGKVIAKKNSFHIIAIRSTVMPGTADRFSKIIEKLSGKKRDVDFAVLSNPEFMREGSAVQDYFHPPFILIGSGNNQASAILASLYKDLGVEIITTGTKEAEIMKYVNNTYHALKISFANEIGNICKTLRIDSHRVMDIFCKDRILNISDYYFKPGFAYGGSCLPKDVKGLQMLAYDNYVNVPLINSISETNDLQIKRAVEIIQESKINKIGFLGLSFKAGTDDLRNSPAVSLIETLLGKGYKVNIYDNKVKLSLLTGTNKEYIKKHIPHLSKLMVNEVSEILHTCKMVVVHNRESEYEEALLNVNGSIHILDMIGIEKLKSKPLYKGINW